jgi:DNA-binding CsgD family transcriptional regulator
MMPDKSALQAGSATSIQSFTGNSLFPDIPFLNSYSRSLKHEAGRDKISFPYKNRQLVRLEQRVKALEHQNHHLLYFIRFLNENFPDVFKGIVPAAITAETMEKEPAPMRKEENDEYEYSPDETLVALGITKRERQVLDLLAEGLTAKEIACRLFISETTVITHKKKLKEKFNARNTAELLSKILFFKPAYR